ncbi:MAG: NAD(P)H-dependent oxidoreductase subunit E, partial [Anaerolineae bacterium]
MPLPVLPTSEAVASVLASFQGKGRAYLLPCLLAVQRAHGWLSPDLVTRVGAALAVPLADIYGVIDFYTMLYSQPHGRRLLRVCDDIACYLAQPTNCESLRDTIATHTGLRQHGDTTPDGA